MKSHHRKYSVGFTLIELLVVVSILAILTTVGVMMMGSVQRSSRDQQRLRDLVAVKQALELYRNDQRYYPPTTSFSTIGSPLKSPDGSKTYLEAMPADPVSGRNYAYLSCSGQQCASFVICASSESSSKFNLPSECQSAGCGITCSMGVSAD